MAATPPPPDDASPDGQTSGIGEVEAQIARIGAAQAIKDFAALHPGKMPRGMVELADEIMKPNPIPWQHLLAAPVRRLVAFRRGQTNYTYRRVSRRRHNQPLTRADGSTAGRAIFPGTVSPKITVAYIRDTSGSMSSDQLAQVSAEVQQLSARMGVRGSELLILDADTKVHTIKRYTGRTTTNEVTGRGGTDMTAAIQTVWDLPRRPAVCVVATDGETGWPAEPGPVPVIALIVTEDGSKPRWGGEPPAWITTVYASVNR